ncbi:MAG: hypothetical protein AAFR38_01650 [Planctomycetota bacterium]
MRFTGQAEITIDAKSRLAVPSKFRAVLEKAGQAQVWMCIPWPTGALRIYPELTFDRLADGLGSTLTPTSDEAELYTTLFGYCERLEADAAGRIRLTKQHLELTAMPSEVTVIGSNQYLEVRDRAKWQAETPDRFAQLAALVNKAASKPASP